MKFPAERTTAPVTGLPPVPDSKVVIVLLSTTVPDIVISSPDLSISKLRALDPEGIVEGAPTPIIISSLIPAPEFPPDVNLKIFSLADNPSTAAIA